MPANNGTNGYELFVLETDASSSISNVWYDGKINLWPNPADDMVNISIESARTEEVQLAIYDIQGKQVHIQSLRLKDGQQQFTIDINQLSAGAYMYSLTSVKKRSIKAERWSSNNLLTF